MAETSETAGRILRSWMAIEVLTPQVTRDGWNGFAAEKQGQLRTSDVAPDHPGQQDAPGDRTSTPWPLLAGELPLDDGQGQHSADPVAAPSGPRAWYAVVLGALPARQAFEQLDVAFSDEVDEDETNRRTSGHVIAATAVLDARGILVSDRLAISSFAWGLGHMLSGGSAAGLAGWDEQEQDLKDRFGNLLMPLGPGGRFRSLTWQDLRSVSQALADELHIPAELWLVAPCAIHTMSRLPPEADILSSFFLPDLARVLRAMDQLPAAAASYLGRRPPVQPWDALTDRQQLSGLLEPQLFPLGRWPGPGLHPLTLLQQAAVNAIVRDLDQGGIAAVNGPPGTGKTTLLRDLVAHVLVSRAEKLAALDDPRSDLSGLELMDFAMVVASSNNAAVENISLELPIREKALDPSVWRDGELDYFGHTANAVLEVPADAPQAERAWGLMAARLGNAKNRRGFVSRFWSNPDWGLNDWLNQAGWPDAYQARQRPPPGRLIQIDPPPRAPEARADWRTARDAFRQALQRCRHLRAELETLSMAGSRLREVEAQIPAAGSRLLVAERELASATRATMRARADHDERREHEMTEITKLTALTALAPSRLAKLFRTKAWQTHETGVRAQIMALSSAQDARQAAQERLEAASIEEDEHLSEHRAAQEAHDTLIDTAATLRRQLRQGQSSTGDAIPGVGFWAQPDDDLQQASPWNGGAFREARDALFAAAMQLHRAFIVAAVRTIKPALNTVTRALQGGPGAPRPRGAEWGIFFLRVPLVSTTSASVGRMFQGLRGSEIGWLMIDEAGQAPPQAAVGAIWRARRAVVIGDPLQIEPVATTPRRTTRLVFEGNGADPAAWAAPEQSAQTLADRVSPVQGSFHVENGEAGRTRRITGIPLLVHRRCEQPMFGIANRIAYADRMVFATTPAPSMIRTLLGPSAWIDVDAPSSDKWVEAEGRLIAAVIARLSQALPDPPDLYVICPFRTPARQLKILLRDTPSVLQGLSAAGRKDWIRKRVGTVHTFQGKEAEAVILMLGAGRGAKAGSRIWAGRTPNLLNVAVTRAKRAIYIVGNHAEWQDAGVFAKAARMLDIRPEQEWLDTHADAYAFTQQPHA